MVRPNPVRYSPLQAHQETGLPPFMSYLIPLPMTIILIDTHAKALEAALLKINPSISISGTFENGETGVQAILDQKPDIAFVRIDLVRLNTLFNLGPNAQAQVEFVLLSEWFTFAYEAQQFGAADFLLLPFQGAELQKALERVVKRVTDKQIIRGHLPDHNAK